MRPTIEALRNTAEALRRGGVANPTSADIARLYNWQVRAEVSELLVQHYRHGAPVRVRDGLLELELEPNLWLDLDAPEAEEDEDEERVRRHTNAREAIEGRKLERRATQDQLADAFPNGVPIEPPTNT